MDSRDFPECVKCEDGVLVPLSDYGPDGASLQFKAWLYEGQVIDVSGGRPSVGNTVASAAVDPTRTTGVHGFTGQQDDSPVEVPPGKITTYPAPQPAPAPAKDRIADGTW